MPNEKPELVIDPFRIRKALTDGRENLAAAMASHMNVDHAINSAVTECATNKKLLECTVESVYRAVMNCLQLGLYPDSVANEAYLVHFWNKDLKATECAAMPGYQGLVKLAYQSGLVTDIQSVVVHEKDEFGFRRGLNQDLWHTPYQGPDDPGAIAAVYCIIETRMTSKPKWEVMLKRDIEKIRVRSKRADSGPWLHDYGEMAKKTVFRRLYKWIPHNAEMNIAFALYDADYSSSVAEPKPKPATRLDELTDRMGEEPPDDRREFATLEQIVAINAALDDAGGDNGTEELLRRYNANTIGGLTRQQANEVIEELTTTSSI